MKRVFAGTCLAAVFAVGLSAQDPSQQRPPSQAPAADKDSKAVTFTGCVRAGDSPNTFILANIKADDKEKSGATGTSGSMAKAPDQVRLIASGDTKLSEHVGHQVSVTGTLAERSASSSPGGPPATPPAGGAATGTSGADKQPSLSVKTVSMVSSSCSQ
jgi:hypothetical protein